jgi:hypothetical protein
MNARILRVMVLLVLGLAGARGVADEYQLFARTNLLRLIQESGWHGPVGILNHTEEDAEVRLPRYQVIPAAATEALTPTEPRARGLDYSSWPRLHGDQGGRRYSALAQIHRGKARCVGGMTVVRSWAQSMPI